MEKGQYYLFFKDKNGELYRVHSQGITLRCMDERTCEYRGKRGIIKEVLNNTHSNLKEEDIVDVKVMRKPNSKKEEYKEERGPLFKKDSGVLNDDAVLADFELRVFNKEFLNSVLNIYKSIPNFKDLVSETRGLLNAGEPYFDPLQEILDKVSSTYKGRRSMYFIMKKYDKEHNPIRPERSERESIPVNLDGDLKEDTLEYLKEHERELLDIEDFTHYEDLSPFDGNKKIR